MKLNVHKVGQGQPLIILHGFLGTSDNWITTARNLKDKYLVYLVDQRNHGLSPHSETHDLESMAEDLFELIQREKLVDPILLGHSMGGKVVMRYAVDHKDKFSKLIVVDIAPKYYPPHHQQIFKGLQSINIKDLKSRGEADIILKKYIQEEDVRLFLLKNLDRTKEGFRWKANLAVLEKSQTNVGRGLEGSKVTDKPVYFIRGSESDYIVKEDRTRIKELFPQAKIITIKGAGHWVHAQKPEPFFHSLKIILES